MGEGCEGWGKGARREERGKFEGILLYQLSYFLPLLLPHSPFHISLYIHTFTVLKRIQHCLLLFMHAIKIVL